MILFYFFMAIAVALPDYQLYTIPIGDEYSRVHSPFVANKAIIKAGVNHSYGPLIYKTQNGPITYDVKHLTNYGLSTSKTFGNGPIKPFVVGQVGMETNFGELEQQQLLQHKAVIAGLTFHEEDGTKSSIGVIKGTGFFSGQPSTGILASFGYDKERWGFAGSAVIEDIASPSSAAKLTGGMYMSKNKTRFMIEYDKQIDNVFDPDEISVGIRKKFVKNERDIYLISSVSYGLSSMPGSAPRFDIAVSFNLNKNKQEEEEELVVEEEQEETEEIIETTEETIEVEYKEEELFIITQPKGEAFDEPEVKSTPPRRSSRQKSTRTEDNKMPDNSNNTNAYESQPDPTLESINQIAQNTGGDSSVSLLLAMMAVVGGGAAWKFYTQYSEQKHEQKMKQLELDAQAAGLAGAQPPPCQAAKVKLEAELQEVKAKFEGLDRKLAFTADFDADLLERRMKKLERKLQDMEEE